MLPLKSKARGFLMRSFLGAGIGCGVYLFSLTQIGTSLEEWTRDLRLRAREATPPSDAIRLVELDDDDLATFGKWPIQCGIHADVPRILGAMGAERVIVDILFNSASSDPAQDRSSTAFSPSADRPLRVFSVLGEKTNFQYERF